MHFALPPRKTSHPPPYLPRTSRLPGTLLRRHRAAVVATVAGLAFFALVWIVAGVRSGGGGGRGHSTTTTATSHRRSGNPPVVVVTALDETQYSKRYIQTVRENRIQYAEKHGYQTFFPRVGDYDLGNVPASWTKVVAIRHALTLYPECTYIWFLDQDSFVMNPQLTIEEHVMKPARLESIMIKDHPVVPPDSIIKTFGHLKGKDIDFVLTQDNEGLSVGSVVIRNGEWAEFFLETWFDPIYRSYNFQKAEAHALEHIVQWHPTILSKLALIPQTVINSYHKSDRGDAYKDGDIAVRFPDCDPMGESSCEAVSQRFVQQWRTSFKNS